MIIDYSRRTDPACQEGVTLFKKYLDLDNPPKVVHFWTKAPFILAELYAPFIKDLKKRKTVVCAQVTLNHYPPPLEKITHQKRRIEPLVELLGNDSIRLRFDPIIIGYTKMVHYKKVLKSAKKNNISRITINFLVPNYQGVGPLLSKNGINFESGTLEKKAMILQRIRDMTPESIEIAVCAESAQLFYHVKGIKKASCADYYWFKQLGLVGTVKGHASRRGCGCRYTVDWGKYTSKGGYSCPHKCLYCYAKHNIS